MTRDQYVAAFVRMLDAFLEVVPPADRNVIFEEGIAKKRAKLARSISSLGARVDPRREP